ncbi:hypothetical protein EVG20_g5686 [Dentipellis fragilis]|uniref:Nuclear pore complex protein Nup85 n=1 Tax=Dentipellis fragilis TaxID=205917 RepID=A0A4Y9YS31_9AGAM|nr:hypothetical protein EVG20_g5686 [Dentipellis fragilis]
MRGWTILKTGGTTLATSSASWKVDQKSFSGYVLKWVLTGKKSAPLGVSSLTIGCEDKISHDMPPDPTNLEDSIHAALFSGQPISALSHAYQLDVWLAAHLADLMEPLDLINQQPDEETGLSLRQHYVLLYAEYLRSDPALWRITVDYMCSCGSIGKERADEVLLRVPSLPNLSKKSATSTEDSSGFGLRSGELVGTLKEIIKTCFEYEREGVRRMVCSIAAQTFLREREYGLAISYMTSAEDWTGLGRIVDCILTEYIKHGPEPFARSVATVAPSLQSLRSHPGANGVFVHRLVFAVRYAEFHQRRLSGDLQEAALDLVAMFQEEIAPESWWGVLICDAVELLKNGEYRPSRGFSQQREPITVLSDGSMLFSSPAAVELLKRLEEIHVRASQGSGDDYLPAALNTLVRLLERVFGSLRRVLLHLLLEPPGAFSSRADISQYRAHWHPAHRRPVQVESGKHGTDTARIAGGPGSTIGPDGDLDVPLHARDGAPRHGGNTAAAVLGTE